MHKEFYVTNGMDESTVQKRGGTIDTQNIHFFHLWQLSGSIVLQNGELCYERRYSGSCICYTCLFLKMFKCFQLCISVSGIVYAHMSLGAHRFQKRASDPLELELQVVVSARCGAGN